MSIHEYCAGTGKIRYATRAKAEKVAQEMMRKHKHHGEPGRLHGFKCGCCGGCHVGHVTKAAA